MRFMENAASYMALGSLGHGPGGYMVSFVRASLLLAHQLTLSEHLLTKCFRQN